jgi:hypothetical protein
VKYIITEQQFNKIYGSEDKLEVIAKKLSNLFSNENTKPQEFFDRFMFLKKTKSQFLGHINNTITLQLVFLIFSYKTEGNFDLGYRIINSLGFANLFMTEGVPYDKDCDYCGGDGDITCDNCGGDGEVRCEACNGNGEVRCEACDGDGEDDEGNPCKECQGGGRVECENCNGRGRYTCDDCMGYGGKRCPECDGDGYIRTDELLYEYYDICTWSNYLNDRCELKEGTYEVVLSYDDFIDLSEDYIVLEVSTKNAMFVDKIQKDDMYCTYYSDSPSLKISGHKSYPTIGILKNFNDLAPYLE